MLHAGRSVAKQSASNRHWLTKLLHWLWLLVLLRVWLLFVMLLLLLEEAHFTECAQATQGYR